MYLYIQVHKYICLFVHIYIDIYTCIYIYIYIYVCIFIYIYNIYRKLYYSYINIYIKRQMWNTWTFLISLSYKNMCFFFFFIMFVRNSMNAILNIVALQRVAAVVVFTYLHLSAKLFSMYMCIACGSLVNQVKCKGHPSCFLHGTQNGSINYCKSAIFRCMYRPFAFCRFVSIPSIPFSIKCSYIALHYTAMTHPELQAFQTVVYIL